LVHTWEAANSLFRGWEEGASRREQVSAVAEEMEHWRGLMGATGGVEERVARTLHYCEESGVGNVIEFGTMSDLKNTRNVVLTISVSGLSLPSREYYFEDNFKEVLESFKGHLENVLSLMVAYDVQLEDNFVQNVIDFEGELAKYMMKTDQERRFDEYYTNTTLTGLYKEINQLVSLEEKELNYEEVERNFMLNQEQQHSVSLFFEELYEIFGFREVMKKNLEKYFLSQEILDPPNIEQINAFDGDGLRRVLVMILKPSNLPRYTSYLQYKVIQYLSSSSTKQLNDEFFDFYSRKLSGQANPKPILKRVIQIVNDYAGELLGKMYVNKFFPEKYKKDMKQMIQLIIDTLKVSLKNNDWLTPFTKEKALLKLNKFSVKVGYPDVWKDYSGFNITAGDSLTEITKKYMKWMLKFNFYDKMNSVLDRTEWLMTPQTVNAYFMPTQNEIVFPAAILQPPFYCKQKEDIDFDITYELSKMSLKGDYDFTSAVNFGGIGAVIAHEITHGFDDSGRKFDGDGNLEDWWTTEDDKAFKEKTKLMKEQVESYLYIDIEEQKEYHINPELTMGENLADLGGISLSLQAMNSVLEKDNKSTDEVKLNQRVFFKSFANIWKENIKKETLINQLTTNPHSPGHFRANLVHNMAEFYTVFDVSETDRMYLPPSRRLRMW